MCWAYIFNVSAFLFFLIHAICAMKSQFDSILTTAGSNQRIEWTLLIFFDILTSLREMIRYMSQNGGGLQSADSFFEMIKQINNNLKFVFSVFTVKSATDRRVMAVIYDQYRFLDIWVTSSFYLLHVYLEFHKKKKKQRNHWWKYGFCSQV